MAVVLVIQVIYSNRSAITERIQKTQCVLSSFNRNSDIIHQYTSGNSRFDRHMKSIYVLYTTFAVVGFEGQKTTTETSMNRHIHNQTPISLHLFSDASLRCISMLHDVTV